LAPDGAEQGEATQPPPGVKPVTELELFPIPLLALRSTSAGVGGASRFPSAPKPMDSLVCQLALLKTILLHETVVEMMLLEVALLMAPRRCLQEAQPQGQMDQVVLPIGLLHGQFVHPSQLGSINCQSGMTFFLSSANVSSPCAEASTTQWPGHRVGNFRSYAMTNSIPWLPR